MHRDKASLVRRIPLLALALCLSGTYGNAQASTPAATQLSITIWEVMKQVELAIPLQLASLEAALNVNLALKQPHWTEPDVVTYAGENLVLADGKRVSKSLESGLHLCGFGRVG